MNIKTQIDYTATVAYATIVFEIILNVVIMTATIKRNDIP